jgi:hypothetical protein
VAGHGVEIYTTEGLLDSRDGMSGADITAGSASGRTRPAAKGRKKPRWHRVVFYDRLAEIAARGSGGWTIGSSPVSR